MKLTELKRYVFILLLVLLPTQLGGHFWPEWAYVNGVRIDYFAPTIYLTDVLVFLLLVLEIQNSKLKIENFKSKGKILLFYFVVGLLVLLNIYSSLSPAVTVYKWLKVLELGFLVYFVAKNDKFLANCHKFLLIPIFFESVLAIWQFLIQGSVGGGWYFLGERTFNSGTPGIANAYINGSLVLRSYATFPHPNVLGGFLAIVLPFVLYNFLHNSRKLTVWTYASLLILSLGYLALILSMSRVAILVGILATFVIMWHRFGKKIVPWILACLLTVTLVLAPRFHSFFTETEPITVRERLNKVAIEEFAHSPVWGTGMGTSPLFNAQCAMGNAKCPKETIRNYALTFQPTHNIYFLLLAETGIVGSFIFVIIMITALKHLFSAGNFMLEIALTSVLALGLFDHYFLTLQQGQLLLALIVGLSFGRMKKS